MVTVDAPAKINLYLHVTGKIDEGPRSGYHLLDSLIVFADFGDRIVAVPSDNLTLTIEGPFADSLTVGNENLVMQAARGLADLIGIKAKAAITLTKNLPVASGIGGGSADAAAALKALAQLWNVSSDMGNLAVELGTDVPVCLNGCPSIISGFGEIITQVPPLPACWLVLVNPMISVRTPAVFNQRIGSYTTTHSFDAAPGTAEEFGTLLAERRNDLTTAAIELAPPISDVLKALADQPGSLLARLSGSGATCFGLFAGKDEAGAAAEQISRHQNGWWVKSAKICP